MNDQGGKRKADSGQPRADHRGHSDSSGSPDSRRLILLGSTGSIGTNVLEVVTHLQQSGGVDITIAGLAAGGNASLLMDQARRFGVSHVAIADASQSAAAGPGVKVFSGPDAALELVGAVAKEGDLVLGAMVGSCGLPATLEAIDRGCDILLANKETLVAAGQIVMAAVRSRGVRLLPIDSEHSAIFQCLAGGRGIEEVRRVVITSSGGPFRAWTGPQMADATIEQALNHPTWAMGRKITIDSAPLMNKALEIIEAHWLFGVSAGQIEAIIHPQSIVHSFVEFVDGSVLAQMGPPDMKTPIQYALTWPRRVEGCARAMNWEQLRRLDFEPVDHERFPAVRLAYEAIERGGTAAFLDGRLGFAGIAELVRDALDQLPTTPVRTLADVLAADRAAREWAEARLSQSVGM
jgi:1-deoxy-D-xylulose-5-phosphate reductoisomerase